MLPFVLLFREESTMNLRLPFCLLFIQKFFTFVFLRIRRYQDIPDLSVSQQRL